MNRSIRMKARDISPGCLSFNRNKGFALVYVLWLSALLMLIASSYSFINRQHVMLVRNFVEEAKAQALSESGVYIAIAQILVKHNTQSWVGSGVELSQTFANGIVKIQISDESGKINLNSAPKILLRGLLDSQDITGQSHEQIASAIVDWRDKDHVKTPGGAEDEDYLEQGLPYGAKDALFDDVSELLLVIGMTPDIYHLIADSVTIYSHQKSVNPLHANTKVLRAVSLTDGTRLTSTSEVNRFRQRGLEASGHLTLDSKMVFRIVSNAEMFEGGHERIQAIIAVTGDRNKPYGILDWQIGGI